MVADEGIEEGVGRVLMVILVCVGMSNALKTIDRSLECVLRC